MRKFKFAKLVRDKIVTGMIENGQKPVYRVLNDDEYIEELKRKVLEEAAEVPLDDGDDLVTKIADIEEIVDALLKAVRIRKGDVLKIRKAKNKDRGVFKKRHYIDTVEAPDGSKWLEYYLKFPEKYPEVK